MENEECECEFIEEKRRRRKEEGVGGRTCLSSI